VSWLFGALAAITLATLAWGWFEAGWLRKQVVEIVLEGLPPELDGLRIAHLSDFHLGVVSRGTKASEDAVEWVLERRPDLVCVTGDLVSRTRGVPPLRRLLARLGESFVVLGNHDFADSRDPFSERIEPEVFEAIDGVTLLRDEATVVELRGRRVQVVGVEPGDYARRVARPQRLADSHADLRILLCHFPGIVRRMPSGAFDLILAGHLHAGQIVVPLPWRKLGLAHLGVGDVHGVYRYDSTVLHVSPGLGTTFVPFRFFARPEVTELVVRSPGWNAGPHSPPTS
jgi:predicted MPP superfamily phosphohydrolase